MSTFTDSQKQAIVARGNILVVAGAGTGKTRTLVERCLALIDEGVSLENLLLVTFTDAAAAEMRKRIREGLERKYSAEPQNEKLAEQLALLDMAQISTLHSFCLQLVRRNFYELGLDPQVSVFDEKQVQPLINETLDSILQRHYVEETTDALAVRELIQKYGGGDDEKIRALILKLHRYTQTLPSPAVWIENQMADFAAPTPKIWEEWLKEGFRNWRELWLSVLETLSHDVPNFATCFKALNIRIESSTEIAAALQKVMEALNEKWPSGSVGKFRDPNRKFFEEAEFLHSLASSNPEKNPLAEDWKWVRHSMTALLKLARDFSAEFSRAKREAGGMDFSDLEQFSLRLLIDSEGAPTATAQFWREQFHYVFVDEYQDINAAQDAILTAISRDEELANRFLVGDIKQSIYRFRLADPKIFREYEEDWRKNSKAGQRIPLADNFRSAEGILNFINPLFSALMRSSIGGVNYDADARLRFGSFEKRKELSFANDADPRVEFHLLTREAQAEAGENGEENKAREELFDLKATEKEARLIALRLRELKDQQLVWDDAQKTFRPAAWRDMVILLRSPGNKTESFAKEFNNLGVPLIVARAGFFQSIEISDLLSLLKLLDNPLQDVPLLAVLRSPLVGLSLEDLVEIRAHNREPVFWTTLQIFHRQNKKSPLPVWEKVNRFLEQFENWRKLISQTSLSHCLETVLTQTHYESLLLAENRGAEAVANIRRLLDLAQQYDPYQRQGLFRFLRFVEQQEDSDLDYEPAPAQVEDAVQLMSIHKSKGLEFPVVVVAGLGGKFNFQDLNADILLNDFYGLCPKVVPPNSNMRYPSLPYWLARQQERKELLGEELRLLYVAMTRARDRLVLIGTASGKASGEKWPAAETGSLPDQAIVGSRSFLDWLRLWLPQITTEENWTTDFEGQSGLLRWNLYAEDDERLLSEKNEAIECEAPLSAEIDETTLSRLSKNIAWRYPFQDAATLSAKTSVSALRRRLTDETDEESKPLFQFKFKSATGKNKLSKAAIGTAHHLFLELISLENPGDRQFLEKEAERLARQDLLSNEEISTLDLGALSAFWKSKTGEKILKHKEKIQRELTFTARFSPADLERLKLAKHVENLDGEFLVVQGALDLAVILPEEIWLLDFKTDEIKNGELEEKAAFYESQLALYAEAIGQIYHLPVTHCWLHFLKKNKTISVDLLLKK